MMINRIQGLCDGRRNFKRKGIVNEKWLEQGNMESQKGNRDVALPTAPLCRGISTTAIDYVAGSASNFWYSISE
jgi:hypothetical protein